MGRVLKNEDVLSVKAQDVSQIEESIKAEELFRAFSKTRQNRKERRKSLVGMNLSQNGIKVWKNGEAVTRT